MQGQQQPGEKSFFAELLSDRNCGPKYFLRGICSFFCWVLTLAGVIAIVLFVGLLLYTLFSGVSIYVASNDLLHEGYGSAISCSGSHVFVGQLPTSTHPLPADLPPASDNTTAEDVLVYYDSYFGPGWGSGLTLDSTTFLKEADTALSCPDQSGADARFGCALASESFFQDYDTDDQVDVVVIGADAANGTGAVYVFTRVWEFTGNDNDTVEFNHIDTLHHPELAAGAQFGASVALERYFRDDDGNAVLRLIVGAPGNSTAHAYEAVASVVGQVMFSLVETVSADVEGFGRDVSLYDERFAVAPGYLYGFIDGDVFSVSDGGVVGGPDEAKLSATAVATGWEIVVATNGTDIALSKVFNVEDVTVEEADTLWIMEDAEADLTGDAKLVTAYGDMGAVALPGVVYVFGPYYWMGSSSCDKFDVSTCFNVWDQSNRALTTRELGGGAVPGRSLATFSSNLVVGTDKGFVIFDMYSFAATRDLTWIGVYVAVWGAAFVAALIFGCCVPYMCCKALGPTCKEAAGLSGSRSRAMSDQSAAFRDYDTNPYPDTLTSSPSSPNEKDDRYAYNQYNSGPEII